MGRKFFDSTSTRVFTPAGLYEFGKGLATQRYKIAVVYRVHRNYRQICLFADDDQSVITAKAIGTPVQAKQLYLQLKNLNPSATFFVR